MTPEKNPEVIFNKALEITDPDKQAEYMEQACAGDEKLRAEVEFLLKSHQQAGSFLERLELFVSVCQSVQHAHQKGIIHSDIKPSNVMVTLHDGQPVPKVIDFGIAIGCLFPRQHNLGGNQWI